MHTGRQLGDGLHHEDERCVHLFEEVYALCAELCEAQEEFVAAVEVRRRPWWWLVGLTDLTDQPLMAVRTAVASAAGQRLLNEELQLAP